MYDTIQDSLVSSRERSGTPVVRIGLDTLLRRRLARVSPCLSPRGDWGATGQQYDATSNSCVTGTTQNAGEMTGSPHV